MTCQINGLEEFIYQAKSILFSYFKNEIGTSKITLSDVYPISIDNFTNSVTNHKDLHIHLSQLYENIVPVETRKDYGQFYTIETSVINLMLEDIDVMRGKILEPGCGTGMFLVEIIKRIINKLKEQNYTEEKIIEYILNNIYGTDIDEYALQITEINILAEILPIIIEIKKRNESYKIPKFHLNCNDFTKKDFGEVKFQLVIGNPPYVTLYGKRSRNMTEEKRAYYNTFDFVQNKNGNNKFNLAMFFIENGLKMLSKEGNLYYILDISFFETAFIDMRKYIVQNYYIESITKGLQEFEGVASGQILLNIKNIRSYNKSILFRDYTTGAEFLVNQELWDNDVNNFKYYIPLDGIEKEINIKVKKYEKLDSFYPKKALRTCCALTGRTEDFVVNPKDKIPQVIYPYIEGSKGLDQKFGHLSETKYIKYDYELQLKISDEFKEELEKAGVKNKKRVTLGDNEMYDAPKLFIRQSAFEIIATYTEKPYAANNSIYVMSNKDYSDTGKNFLKYVCGIMNSDLITYFCRVNKIIRMEKGKTPQIKISDLKEVRICVDDSRFNDVIRIVEILLENPDDGEAKRELNELVYEIYNITSEEQRFIESSIAS